MTVCRDPHIPAPLKSPPRDSQEDHIPLHLITQGGASELLKQTAPLMAQVVQIRLMFSLQAGLTPELAFRVTGGLQTDLDPNKNATPSHQIPHCSCRTESWRERQADR